MQGANASHYKGGKTMSRGIADEMFQEIIAYYWEQIGSFAFDEFRQKGRGVVGIERRESNGSFEEHEFLLSYAVYDLDSGKLEFEIAGMIRTYDPKWEIIIQYTRQEGDVRTIRLHTPEGGRHPWQVWFFENLPVPEQEFEPGKIEEHAS
jgi:hypothetical protein